VPGARVLRSDVIRKRLMGVAPETRLPEAAYDAESSAAVYAQLGEEAGPLLRAGRSVILDAVFGQPEERAAAEAVARELGFDFQGFWLEAPPGVMASRIADRRHDASDATVEILSRQLTFSTGAMTWQRLDAAGAPAAVLAAAEQMIG
jgi:predicted kinase